MRWAVSFLVLTVVHFDVKADYFPAPEAKLVETAANTESLVFVTAVWRHGDRTPSVLLPNDTGNPESSWTEGLGELTVKGIAQQFRLGQWLRRRYGDFLGRRFTSSEIYVRSSDYNRTLMSAQANMAGLFPPTGDQQWSKDLPWMPIPVHTVPRELDLQLYEEISCPRAEEDLRKEWETSERALRIEKENAQFLEYLGHASGLATGDKKFRLSKMWNVFDPLNSEWHHNETHPWPAWMNDSLWKKVQEVYDESAQFTFHTPLLRRLRGGPLLSEILDRMQSKVDGRLDKRSKFLAYSAHDTTIAAVLAALGIFPRVFPLYATAVIFELHKRNDAFIVEIYHKNETDSELLYRHSIRDCGEPCSLASLHEKMRPFLPEDWQVECGRRSAYDMTNVIIAILSLTTLVFGGIVLVDVILRLRHRRHERGRGLLEEDEDEIA